MLEPVKVLGFQPVSYAIRSERECLPISPVAPIAPVAPVLPVRKTAPLFFVPFNFFENFLKYFIFNYYILGIFHDIVTSYSLGNMTSESNTPIIY